MNKVQISNVVNHESGVIQKVSHPRRQSEQVEPFE
jgi:hypothetical protein